MQHEIDRSKRRSGPRYVRHGRRHIPQSQNYPRKMPQFFNTLHTNKRLAQPRPMLN
jgi:hypothetical protein